MQIHPYIHTQIHSYIHTHKHDNKSIHTQDYHAHIHANKSIHTNIHALQGHEQEVLESEVAPSADSDSDPRHYSAVKIQRRARGMNDRQKVKRLKEKGELPGQKRVQVCMYVCM
jgi:hypothetical protein